MRHTDKGFVEYVLAHADGIVEINESKIADEIAHAFNSYSLVVEASVINPEVFLNQQGNWISVVEAYKCHKGEYTHSLFYVDFAPTDVARVDTLLSLPRKLETGDSCLLFLSKNNNLSKHLRSPVYNAEYVVLFQTLLSPFIGEYVVNQVTSPTGSETNAQQLVVSISPFHVRWGKESAVNVFKTVTAEASQVNPTEITLTDSIGHQIRLRELEIGFSLTDCITERTFVLRPTLVP